MFIPWLAEIQLSVMATLAGCVELENICKCKIGVIDETKTNLTMPCLYQRHNLGFIAEWVNIW